MGEKKSASERPHVYTYEPPGSLWAGQLLCCQLATKPGFHVTRHARIQEFSSGGGGGGGGGFQVSLAKKKL